MSKDLQIGNKRFVYPSTGDIKWSEGATGWAVEVTNVLATVQGPQDILRTEAALTNGTSGNINGLKFDTGQVQQVSVKGYIKREYTTISGIPDEVESIIVDGAYNGAVFNITAKYIGDDVGVSVDVDNTGQFTYVAEDKTDTETLTIIFEAKAITV